MLDLTFQPQIIGHRGACAYAPENTMASFIKAAQCGLQWVEFDVMQAATGEAMIFHDELLCRTTNGEGLLADRPIKYLKSLDAGSWFNPAFSGERIPELMTVLGFLHEAKMFANIELKSPLGQEKQLVDQVLAEMAHYLLTRNHHYLFSSFSVPALEYLHELAPQCQIGLLLHEWEPGWEDVCETLGCVSVHVNDEIMTEEAACKIKGKGKRLLCYTVNDPERAAQLFSWGVDAVFSDAPDRIKEIA